MEYLIIFLAVFFAIALGLPIGNVLTMFAEAAVRWYMDYRAEIELRNKLEDDSTKEEPAPPEKTRARPHRKRLDPEAERVTRSMP